MLRVLSWLCAALLLPAEILATTASWTNSSGGNWNVAGNWSTGQVPSSSDTVVITLSGTYTVTLNTNATVAALVIGGSTGVQTLLMSSKTLTINGASTIYGNGIIDASSSTINGSGSLTVFGQLKLAATTVSPAVTNKGLVLAAASGSGSTLSGTFAADSGSTLRVETSSNYNASLTVSNGFTNNGTIELKALSSRDATLAVTSGTLVNPASGTVTTSGAQDGTRYLNAQLNNQGSFTVGHPTAISRAASAHTNSGTITISGGHLWLTLSGSPATFTNTGTISMSAGRRLTAYGGTFNHNSGTLGSHGTFVVDNSATANVSSTFCVDSLAVNSASGNSTVVLSSTLNTDTTAVYLYRATLTTAGFTISSGNTVTIRSTTINGPLTNNGTLLVSGDSPASSFTGQFSTGSSSLLRLSAPSYMSTLNFSSGFTNRGTLEIYATNSWTSTVSVNGGTLVNDTVGTISTSGDANGSRSLNAKIDNKGTLSVTYALGVNKASTQHVNSGSISISGSGYLWLTQTGTSPSLTNTGTISMSAGRRFTIYGGTFTHSGGSLGSAGTLVIDNSATGNLNYAFTVDSLAVNASTFSSSLSLTTSSMKIYLNKATFTSSGLTNVAGRTMTVGSSTVNGAVTNRGTIVAGISDIANTGFTGAFSADTGSTLRIEALTSRNSNVVFSSGWTNNGVLELKTATSYSSTLTLSSGTLINAVGATITTPGGASGTRYIDAPLDNRGILTVSYPLTISKTSGSHLNRGTITLSGSTLTLSSGTLQNIAGGLIQGTGTYAASGTTLGNGGAIAPGTSLGLLSLTGSVACSTASALNIELGGTAPGSQYDRFTVSGSAGLGGTLNITLINGYQPQVGTSFYPFKYGSRSGQFATVTGTDLGGGVIINPQYLDTSLVLTVANAPPPNAPVLASPDSGAVGVDTALVLKWHPSAYATSYHVQAATDTSFSSLVLDQSGVTDTAYALSGLVFEKPYYWRVNAANVSGTSPWSCRRPFTTKALSISTLPYQESFETNARGWASKSIAGAANDWVVGTPNKAGIYHAHGGQMAYLTNTTGNYPAGHNAYIISPMFDFTNEQYPALRFWHNFMLFGGPDFAVVEQSSDGGITWSRLDSVLGAASAWNTSASLHWYNSTDGGVHWGSYSSSVEGSDSGWIQSTTKLYHLAGLDSVRLRWRLHDDSTYLYGWPTTDKGWAVDDISVCSLPPLSGTYTVGHEQDAPLNTITGAASWLESLGIQGPVAFSLTDTLYSSGESFPITFRAYGGSTSGVTLKPASGVHARITGSSANAILLIEEADRLTIDGSNQTGGTSRDLIIENTRPWANTAAVWIAGGGARNNTIKNCHLICGVDQSTSTDATFGFFSGGYTISTSSVGSDNDSNTVENNYITKARFGIFSRGYGSSNPNVGSVISGNTVGPPQFGSDQIGVAGIVLQNDSCARVESNEVRFVGSILGQSVSGSARVGIAATYVESYLWPPSLTYLKETKIQRNTVHDIVEEKGTSAAGILLSGEGGTTHNVVANNIIYRVRANTTGDVPASSGIVIAGGVGDVVGFNSVLLSGDIDPDTCAAATGAAVGIDILSTEVADLTVANNISEIDVSSNDTTLLHSAFSIPPVITWGNGGVHHNDWYAPSENAQSRVASLGGRLGIRASTMADWQTLTGLDSASFSQEPPLVSASDLHIKPGVWTPIDSGGAALTGVSVDYDGDSRNAYHPDIGADEFTQTPVVVSSFPYTEGFEGAASGWLTGTLNRSKNHWVRGSPSKSQLSAAHGGIKAFVTRDIASYSNSADGILVSPIFNFTQLTSDLALQFWHNFKFEEGYDGAFLEVTTNGGGSWSRVDSSVGSGAYRTTSKSHQWYNGSPSAASGPAWSGSSTAYPDENSGWVRSTTLLSGFAGKSTVRFRWRFVADESGVDQGWAIDDVTILPQANDIALCGVSLSTTPLPFAAGRGIVVAMQLKNVGSGANPESLLVTYKAGGVPDSVGDGTPEIVRPSWSGDSSLVTLSSTFTPNAAGYLTVGARCFVSGDGNVLNDSSRSEFIRVYDEGTVEEIHRRTGLARAIPDNYSGTLEDTLSIPFSKIATNQVITEIQVLIDTLIHPYAGDVMLSIIRSGDSLDLSLGNGGSGSNYVGTIFDDTSSPNLGDGTAPFTGIFQPDGRPGLGTFVGTATGGPWILRVRDNAEGDVGELRQWGVRVLGTTPAQNDVSPRLVLAPENRVLQGSSVVPRVRVQNFGSTTSSFQVQLKVTDAQSQQVYSQTQSTSNLAPAAFTDISLPASWFASDTGTFTATAITQLAGDQRAANDTVRQTILVTTDTRTCLSPDSGGYVFSASNSTANPRPSFHWVNAGPDSGTFVTGSAADEFLSPVIQLPWPFTFYGIASDSIRVSSNGWLAFVDAATGNSALADPFFSEAQIPNSSPPNYLIAPLWDDLDTMAVSGRGIYTRHDSSKFTIQWHRFRRFVPSVGQRPDVDNLTFQVVLDSADGTVTLSYADSAHGGFRYAVNSQGSIGIEGSGASGLGKWAVTPPLANKQVPKGVPQSDLHRRQKAVLTVGGVGVDYYYQGDKPLNNPESGVSIKFSTNEELLELQFRYMAVVPVEDRVEVTWGTAKEIHTRQFDVERSRQLRQGFAAVPRSQRAGQGTTDVPQNYRFVDSTAQGGTWYYRVKLTDEKGMARYSAAFRVEVRSDPDQVPREFVLYQNFPNPFNPATEIRFTVPATGKATLRLFNILGQEVKTLFNDLAEAGKLQKVRFDGGTLATGVYFYRLESGARTDTKKLVLVK
jgi:hypothetical protein